LCAPTLRGMQSERNELSETWGNRSRNGD